MECSYHAFPVTVASEADCFTCAVLVLPILWELQLYDIASNEYEKLID